MLISGNLAHLAFKQYTELCCGILGTCSMGSNSGKKHPLHAGAGLGGGGLLERKRDRKLVWILQLEIYRTFTE